MTEEESTAATGSIPVRVPPDENGPPVAREMIAAVAVVTMQHAPHNLIGDTLLNGLLDAVSWAVEQKARAVLLRSALRNFSAGADLALFDGASQGEAPDLDVTKLLRVFDQLPIPIVVAVNGVCVGGGFELAMAGDLIVAAEAAKIGSVEASLGLNPLMGGIQRVTERAGAARAKEMAMLARRYDASTLERWNIINNVVADEHLHEVSLTLAQELANGPTVAHASTKAIVSHAVSHGVDSSDAAMKDLQKKIWRSSDLRTGLQSLQKSGPGTAHFEGC